MKILKKQSKNYTINDIENLFTLIPTLFILILATFSLVISFLIIDFKQKKDFELIKQKKILNFKFEKKDQLYKFSDEVENKVNKRFSYVKAQLQETIFKTVGYWDAKFSNKLNLNDLLIYLNKFEKNEGVQFVIFEKESLKILYGKDMILHLQQVMFNNPNTKKFKKLTLQYIASQGKNNLQSWKYDLQKNLILSYFDVTKIKEKEYLIGVFSSINNIKQLTKEIIISSIKEMTSPVDYDIWFYDSNTKKTFNFNNKQQFKTSADILFDVDKKTKKHEILDYYQSNDDENKNYSKQLYYYSKYSYFIGIDYNKNILKEKDARIKMIVKEYKALFLKTFLFITAITAIMLLFSFIFSNFIKNIFGKYHLELKIKTDSLEHWKKRFELAIIASNDGLWDIDFKTKKIYFSDKWLDMFGYNEGEVETFSDWFNLIHNEDKANVEKLFDKIFAKHDDTFICEYRLQTKNKGFRWVLARGKSFVNVKNELDRMLMMSMDIDKNKRMKKELLDVELLVEDGKIVIFKLLNDDNLSVKYISNSVKTFGYTKQEFESNEMSFMNLIYKDDINKIQVAINAALKKDLQNFTVVCRVINAANEIRWISSRVILIKNHSGDVSHFYGYINDITKIKVSQEELKLKVEDEVKKNRKKDRLLIQQSKLASMGEMLGNIAHQWRQPLNTVNLILHFLRDNYKNKDFTKDKLEKYINKSKIQIDYMSQTIDDFRKFYKPSKKANQFSISQAINEVLKISKEQFEHDNIEVNIETVDVIITNYENELKQSLLNILNNAKDAIIKKREKEEYNAFINIKVIEKQKNVKIIIQNNGGEINRDIIEKIFEPYFTTKFETQGTGIGLYMTKTIIETNMKGKIKVENMNNGVRFMIILPLQVTLGNEVLLDE